MTEDISGLIAELHRAPGWPTLARKAADALKGQADIIDALQARIAELEAHWPKWARSILSTLQEFGWRFDDMIDLPEELENYLKEYPDSAVDGLREDRDQLRDENERLREVLVKLEKAGTEVSRLGAVTGGQWSRLTTALLFTRAALQRKAGE